MQPLQTKHKFLLKTIALALSLLPTSCFEYQERLLLRPDFSGFIDVDYTVPVYPHKNYSLISSLPSEQKEVEALYLQKIPSHRITIENFKSEYFEVKEGLTKRHARVVYRVLFSDPQDLEHLLLGRTSVVWRKGRLSVQRTLAASKPLPEKTSRMLKNFHTTLQQNLAGKTLSFTVIYPWYFDLVTNQGTLKEPGVQNLTIPLERTINANNALHWSFDLRANVAPKEGNGTAPVQNAPPLQSDNATNP